MYLVWQKIAVGFCVSSAVAVLKLLKLSLLKHSVDSSAAHMCAYIVGAATVFKHLNVMGLFEMQVFVAEGSFAGLVLKYLMYIDF